MRAPCRWIVVLALGSSVFACDRPTKGPAGSAPADEGRIAAAAPAEVPTDPAATEPEAPEEPKYAEAAGLSYAEVMLGGAKPEDTVPMIVAIHGLGDEPHNFSKLFETFPEPARLILPRALDPYDSGGWSWFPIRARDPDVASLSAGIRKAAKAIAPAIAALQKSKPTRGKPIVTGFSQGGMLTFTLAVHHPEVVGEAVAIGGWLPPPLWPEKKPDGVELPAIHAIHGTADNAVRFEPTQQAVDHLKKLGYAVRLRSYEGVQHVITPEIRRDLFDDLVDAVHEAGQK